MGKPRHEAIELLPSRQAGEHRQDAEPAPSAACVLQMGGAASLSRGRVPFVKGRVACFFLLGERN